MTDNDVKIKVSLDGADTVQKGLNGVGDSAGQADSKLGQLASGGLKGAGVALGSFVLAAAAAGGALAVAVTKQYSDYQQFSGGIEKLFGDSADQVQKYAAEAYQTAGLSANDYLNQATSFSAALITGLHGDQKAAAEEANKAIIDMSDNANVFGSDIGSIQMAYQGFAKQNYTMLDNLKLGFGGTAQGMADLVNQSGVMGSSFKATAENINSVSYDKIIDAIHTVQVQMGVAGDTAEEASTTIAGSVAQLQGAYKNFLTGLGSTDSDIVTLAGNLVTSFQTVVTNVTPVIDAIGDNFDKLGPKLGEAMDQVIKSLADAIPAILNTGVALVEGLITGLTSALPGLLTAIVPALVNLVNLVFQLGPQLITAGVQAILQLANGIASALPELIPTIVTGTLSMVQALLDALPLLVNAGIALIMGLATGVLDSLPLIVAMLPDLINSIVVFIGTAVPDLLDAAVALFMGIVDAIPQVIPPLLAALPGIIESLITAILGAIPLLYQAAISLLMGLVQAIPTVITSIVAALPDIITSIITSIVSAIPMLVQAGIDLLVALIQALPTIIIAIVTAIPQIIIALVAGIIAAIPSIIKAGIQLITSLITDLPTIIAAIIKAIPAIVTGIFNAFTDPKMTAQLGKAGLQLIQGLWQGISDAGTWLYNKISGFFGGVVDHIKDFFGIHSPSKLIADEIGAMIPAGAGLGITTNISAVLDPIDDMNAQILAQASKLNTSANFTSQANFTQTLVPMQPIAQQPGNLSVEATLDPNLLSTAITDAFTANDKGKEQSSVALSKDSIASLASAIVDSIRVQSRQGVSILG